MAIEIEVSVEAYDVNSVIPAKAIAPVSQIQYDLRTLQERQAKAERERAEAERVSKIEERIIQSGILAEINNALLNGYGAEFLIGEGLKNHRLKDPNQYSNTIEWNLGRTFSMIPNVKNQELVAWLETHYANAGYGISTYTYSKSYWKDYEMTIHPPVSDTI